MLHKMRLIVAILVLAVAAYAQNISGSISGQVTDASGAVVPNAKVTATQVETNIARTATSDNSGHYTFPLLPIGHYQVSIEASGFKRVDIKNVELNVNDKLTENTAMQVGSGGDVVTVTADAQQVQLQSATASNLITGTQIRELSLNNRNYEQLVNLMPGVAYGGGDQLFIGTTNPSGQTNVVSFSINGQRNSANNWTVDGADNVDRGSNLTLLNYPSVDAIAEFKVLRGLYSPEFGRAAAGQINVVTKSGSNGFHGGAYEFFRNDKLNANNYFNKPNAFNPAANVKRPPLRYNNFGYTVGGPIFKDKTFFFFSQEFRRIITYGSATATVATAAMKTGTFAHPVCLVVRAAGDNTNACATTGTQISNINPVAAAYIQNIFSKIAEPGANNLLSTARRNIFNHRQELLRIDHTFNSKFSIFGRYINDVIPTEEPGGLFTGAVLPGVSTTRTNSPGRSWLAHGTYTYSPTLLIDGGYAHSYGAITSDPIGLISSKLSPINVALPFASTLGRVPSIGFTAGSGIAGFGPYRDFNRDHNAFANATKVSGRHTFKWGGSFHHYQKTENNGGPNAGSFSFSNQGKPAGGATDFEQAWANFLLGNAVSFSQASLDLTPDIRTQQWEAYAQDEWKISRNVNLTYGLRYSFFGAPFDEKKELTNFDSSKYDPAKAPTLTAGGLIVAGTGDPLNGIIINGQNSPYGKNVSSQNYSNIAPRLGLVWDPFGDGKTSVRTGYGLFYDASLFGIYEQNIFSNPPFVNNISISNTRFENATAAAPNVSLVPKTLRGTPVKSRTPNTQQWSLDVQRQIWGGTIFDVGFYGSKSTHLIGIIDINQPQVGAYVTAGLAAAGALSGSPASLNTIRPYKGYGPINTIQPLFNANYNSLQVSAQKRFAGRSSIGINYTWSKALTDAQSDRSSAAQNTYNIAGEYGRTALDRTHIFNTNFVYELPWLRDGKGLAGHVLGGWEVSGILAANSGLPLTIFAGGSADPAGQGCRGPSACSVRPDLVADPNGPKTILQWFNTAAFTNVPAGQARPGNERRGVVNGPGFWRTDLSLFKNFNFTERVGLQFRAETFNALNHTNLDAVGTTTGVASTFGKVVSARDPRNIQFGLKLNF